MPTSISKLIAEKVHWISFCTNNTFNLIKRIIEMLTFLSMSVLFKRSYLWKGSADFTQIRIWSHFDGYKECLKIWTFNHRSSSSVIVVMHRDCGQQTSKSCFHYFWDILDHFWDLFNCSQNLYYDSRSCYGCSEK